jgi:mRNA-degrading endonuclease YafQ of YafQ-DinJ toxin-antitoxin module
MSKVIFIAQDLAKTLKKIKKKDPVLFCLITKQLKLFSINPKHPSLRLHKLKGELRHAWSISVGMQYRLLFTDGNDFYFFAFGTHKEVYDKAN